MQNISKEDLLNEIRGFMWALASSLGRVYRPDVGWALLGIERDRFPAHIRNAHYSFTLNDLELKDIDPSKFTVTEVLLEMYDYGVDGLRRTITHNWIDFATDTEAFIIGLMNFPLLYESGIEYRLDLTSHVLRLATARWKLDDEEGMSTCDNSSEPWYCGILTLGEVALLAGMDEKSVRNATNPKVKNYLRTFNSGSRTYVNAQDAREWLSGRRGFKPTVNIESERDLTKVGFFSAMDFGSFIRTKREKKNLDITEVSRKLSLEKWPPEKLAELENGHFFMDRAMLEILADILTLQKKPFLTACLGLHQKIERTAFETYLTEIAIDQPSMHGPK